MAMASEEKETERNYLIPLWQDWKYGDSLATPSGAWEPVLMGITLELLTNEIIRPQPRPNEKDLHFNKILGQFIHILIFETCCLRSLPFALQSWSRQRAAHMGWGTCLNQEDYSQPEGRMDSFRLDCIEIFTESLRKSAKPLWIRILLNFQIWPISSRTWVPYWK